LRAAGRENAIWVARYALPEEAAELLVAELDSLGTLGIEERESAPGEVLVLAYFRAADDSWSARLPSARPWSARLPSARWDALARAARIDPRARWLGTEPVEDADWESAWRTGLAPRCIAGLWVRPSWCAPAGAPEIVIDPEQAFGSGEHATTRLALRLLLESLWPGDAVLDVGCGSGILALGALRCGAASALAFDLDPVACANASGNRCRNALPLQLYCGTLDALSGDARFDVVVANLLWSQLEPCLPRLLGAARRELVVSGLLESQREVALAHLLQPGWESGAQCDEDQGGDRWCAIRVHRSLQY
jgi:ribosomal protein L11 methyltransferase